MRTQTKGGQTADIEPNKSFAIVASDAVDIDTVGAKVHCNVSGKYNIQFEGDSAPQILSLTAGVTYPFRVKRVWATGTDLVSNPVVDELFASVFDVPVSLAHANMDASVVAIVTSQDGGTTYTAGTDYTVDYAAGTITVLSTGTMLDATSYKIDYTYLTVGVTGITSIIVPGTV